MKETVRQIAAAARLAAEADDARLAADFAEILALADGLPPVGGGETPAGRTAALSSLRPDEIAVAAPDGLLARREDGFVRVVRTVE